MRRAMFYLLIVTWSEASKQFKVSASDQSVYSEGIK